MKAIDIIEALVSGFYNLEQMGVYIHRNNDRMQDYFGNSVVADDNVKEDRVYLYWYNNEDELLNNESPDAILMDPNGEVILLYEIE